MIKLTPPPKKTIKQPTQNRNETKHCVWSTMSLSAWKISFPISQKGYVGWRWPPRVGLFVVITSRHVHLSVIGYILCQKIHPTTDQKILGPSLQIEFHYHNNICAEFKGTEERRIEKWPLDHAQKDCRNEMHKRMREQERQLLKQQIEQNWK